MIDQGYSVFLSMVRHGHHRALVDPVTPRVAYALASFLATGVFDENDELLATLAIQLHPDT